MSFLDRYQWTSKFKSLATYNFRGVPLGIIIGFAAAASITAYAAPNLFDSKTTPSKPSSQHSVAHNSSKSSSQSKGSTTEPGQPNNPSTTPTNSTNTPSSSKSSGSASTSTLTTSTTPVTSKPPATVTGIAIISPTPGANETIYIPYCDFGSISSGTPQTCNHYKPIYFALAEQLSDGTTSPLSWSSATITAPNPRGGYPVIPTLLQIDETNNQLDEGTGMGYFLGSNTQDAVYEIDVKYQGWTYAKYIHIYVNSLWG